MPVLPRATTDKPTSPSPAVLVPCILGFLLLVALFCLAFHRWVHQDDTKNFEEIASEVRNKRSNTVTSRVSNLSIDAENLRGALHKAVRSEGSAIQVRSPSPIMEENEEEDGEEDDGDGGEITRVQSIELSSRDREKEGESEGSSRGLGIPSAQRPRRVSLLSTRSEGVESTASVKTWGSLAAPASWVLRWNSKKRNGVM